MNVVEIITLEAIAVLCFFADNVENRVDKLGALGVVALGPVVAGAGLAEDEVVGAEDLAVRAGADAVHGAGLEVHEESPGDEAAAGGLVVVDIDSVELETGSSGVVSGGVDPVFLANNFPELGTDLVPALPGLNMQDFTHLGCGF